MVANEWRWLATGCGHSKMHGVGKAICANVVHSAAVRCCSINGDRCVSVCGQEHPSLYTSNASTAYAACATRGLRLCIRMELLKKNLCCQNGCQSDARPVWTDETCAPADDCTDASFCQVAPAQDASRAQVQTPSCIASHCASHRASHRALHRPFPSSISIVHFLRLLHIVAPALLQAAATARTLASSTLHAIMRTGARLSSASEVASRTARGAAATRLLATSRSLQTDVPEVPPWWCHSSASFAAWDGRLRAGPSCPRHCRGASPPKAGAAACR